jgi:hypothetical protein
MNKIKKMALRVIAERLSEEEIGGLKELFKMIDTDVTIKFLFLIGFFEQNINLFFNSFRLELLFN